MLLAPQIWEQIGVITQRVADVQKGQMGSLGIFFYKMTFKACFSIISWVFFLLMSITGSLLLSVIINSGQERWLKSIHHNDMINFIPWEWYISWFCCKFNVKNMWKQWVPTVLPTSRRNVCHGINTIAVNLDQFTHGINHHTASFSSFFFDVDWYTSFGLVLLWHKTQQSWL